MEIFVSIPFDMLVDKYLSLCLEKKLNIEVGLPYNVLDEFSYLKFKEVARLLEEKGLKTTVHLPFMDLSPGALDPWIKEVSLRRITIAMERAAIFKPLSVVLHSGYHPDYHREKREDWKASFKDALKYLIKVAKELKIPLNLENTFEPEPEFLVDIFEDFRKDLGWCFDPAHARVFSKKHELEWLEVLYPYIREIHCHDNSGSVDEHLAVGKGVIEFEKIFKFLKEKGLSPVITSEAHTEEDTYLNLKALKQLVD